MNKTLKFFDVWKYYFSVRYIIDKKERVYFDRGTCITFAFLFFLIIPIFILYSPYLYYKTKKRMERKHERQTRKQTNN